MLLARIVTWIVWWGGLALIIFIDGKLRDRAMRRDGEVNLQPRSVWPYLVVGLLCGALVLPIYFWVTRRSVRGLLVGFGWTVALLAINAAVAFVLELLLVHPQG